MRNRKSKPFLPEQTQDWHIFLGILALYSLLIIPTLRRMGIGWDEAVDLEIARGYLTTKGFFYGIPLDLSQTRLPMFSVALVYRVLGVSNLIIARWSSVFVGGLTILGVFVYGKKYFRKNAGLLAAGLLAINPFFLSFARLAFTESDIYLTCALTWLIVALVSLQEKAAIGRASVAGILLGFSISSKATVIVILPAIWFALFYFRFIFPNNQTVNNAKTTGSVPARIVWFCAVWAVCILLIAVYSGIKLNLSSGPGIYRLIHYALVGLGWALLAGWAVRYRSKTADYLSLAALITGFGLLTFVIFPPDHLFNPKILQTIFLRAENEITLSLAYIGELAALHLLSIFFKSTPVLGFALIIGSVVSMFQWRRGAVVLPLLIGSTYFFGLLALPLGQTFYTLPLLPVASLLVADLFIRLWSQRRRIAICVAVLTVGWWAVEIVLVYPDYHLNGYQWVGERTLFGRSSIGYRSVVFTPSDGVEQVVKWLNANAKPGQVAILYVFEKHVVTYTAPNPAYQIIIADDGEQYTSADYIVIHINRLLQQGHGRETPQGNIVRYPFDYHVLKRDYQQVFVVRRAFGLEVASIWQRR